MAMAQIQPVIERSVTQTVSRNVRALMAAGGVSQVAMARAMGVAQSAVSNRLRAQTPWTTDDLAVVSRVLGVAAGDLFRDLLPQECAVRDSNPEPAVLAQMWMCRTP